MPFTKGIISCWSVFHYVTHFWTTFSRLQNQLNAFLKNFHVYKMKRNIFKEISCLKNSKTRFQAFFMFTKWKTTFWRHFHIYNMKKHIFEALSCLQNEKNNFFKHFSRLQNQFKTLLKHFHFYKMKRTRFWSDFMLTKLTKTRFWSVLRLQNEKHIFEEFPCLSNKQKTFLKRFHVYNMKKLCLWSVFISNIVIILQKNHIYQCIIQKNSHLFWKQENLLQSRKIVTLTCFCQLQHKKSLFQILSLPDEKVTFFIKCHWKKMSLSLKNVTLKKS